MILLLINESDMSAIAISVHKFKLRNAVRAKYFNYICLVLAAFQEMTMEKSRIMLVSINNALIKTMEPVFPRIMIHVARHHTILCA